MAKIKIEIDGRLIEVEPGSTVIEAADSVGIYIPRFCYHEKLSIAANCRMCLVDVEKAPKPMPACATPVTDGMKVQTRSAKAVGAQKGVMELLLINHPLDCPVCDQGGECELQDLAMGYGGDVSRYAEPKRIVKDRDIGPLIATELTRCIHCMRCVRFGEELAGLMELGATGRGEHTRIGLYVDASVNSELSGNMIDLCPVGALTSKPFRYSARPWELGDRPSISPHDCVGTNVNIQVRRNRVLRVLPRANEEINEVWIADRDRFSYEGVNGPDRLTVPMIRQGGKWVQTDWNSALQAAADGIQKAVSAHGGNNLGGLVSPLATLEEFYLTQKLVRSLGSNHVDHRLRRRDTRDDADSPRFPYVGMPIRELESVDAALLVGSNIRKEQPLLGLKLRKAFLHGAAICAVNPADFALTFDLRARAIVSPSAMVATVARVAREIASLKGGSIPAEALSLAIGDCTAEEHAIAAALAAASRPIVLLGQLAEQHPQASVLRALADIVAELVGAPAGQLPEANSAAGWLAGCIPHRGPNGTPLKAPGRSTWEMLAEPLRAYIVLGAEPELDCADGRQAMKALKQADFVVALSAFRSSASDYAQVILPIAPFTENEGTTVNAEGRFQSFVAAAAPAGESRPGWKVLRVLGNRLGLGGFDYSSAADIRSEVGDDVAPSTRLGHRQFPALGPTGDGLQRINEVPIYRVDPIVRRATSLQATRDNFGALAAMNPREAQRQGVGDRARVRVFGGGESVALDLLIDRRIPDGCVYIPGGYTETIPLGAVTSVRVEVEP